MSFNDPRGSLAGTLLNLGFEVYGTKAALRSYGTLFQLSGHQGEPVKLRLELEAGGAAPQPVRAGKVKNIYQQIILEHAAAIRSGRRLTGEDGLHNLALVEACYQSAAQGGKAITVS